MSLEISLKHGLLKKDNLLILADENDLTWTKTILSIDQQSTLKAYKSRKLSFLALPGVERSIYIIWIKTGTAPNISSEKSRLAGAEMYQTLNQHKETAVVLLNYCKSNRIYDFLEGLKLASYQFRKYQTNGSDKLPSLRKVAVLDTFKTSDLRLLNTITATTFVARDLVNEVPNAQTPKLFSQSLLQLSNHYGFKLKIIEQDELRKLGFGGLLAVNSGSLDPPTFNILEWKPKKSRNKTPIILVGKGVVYDTGGLSLKPTAGSMDYMKSDMAGGAAVAATMSAA
ncbi:MAG: hypothetical protein ABIV51_00210, partial [Saprospiraceae bacterium]